MWGRTLRSIVDSLERWVVPDPDREVEFIPLFGELPVKRSSKLYEEAYRCSATTLAADLEEIFKGRVTRFRSLSIPACAPTHFLREFGDQDGLDIVRGFIESVPNYREIFIDDPLVEKLDTIISSVGDLEHGWLGWLESEEPIGPILNDEERRQLLITGVIGELAGRYVTKDKVDGFPPSSTIFKVNSRVFGPTPAHFREIARKGREDKNNVIGGVILVAAEPRKAETVHSVVINNCVTDLIISKGVADELKKILGIEEEKKEKKESHIVYQRCWDPEGLEA